MASHESAQELLLDVKVAEASRFYKFYLNQEKKILGTISISIFLIAWELVGNVFQWINPMFMSAPSLIFKAALEMFRETLSFLPTNVSNPRRTYSCRTTFHCTAGIRSALGGPPPGWNNSRSARC